MKRIILLVFTLLVPQWMQAQGTITYVSNLGLSTTGSSAMGSDSFLGAFFITGTNTGGYLLDSVQVAMGNATGNPSGFLAMIYDGKGHSIPGGVSPGSSVGLLTGSASPVTAGIYSYAPASSLTLAANSYYFLMLSAGTPVANGAYNWNVTSTIITGNNSYHWGNGLSIHSSNGTSWSYIDSYGQFAVNATVVPEPGSLALLAVGGLLLGWRMRKTKMTP